MISKLDGNEMKILNALARDGEMYGLELADAAGVKRNGLYVTLNRMKVKGLITLRKTVRHRFWSITPHGVQMVRASQAAAAILAEAV